MHTPLTSSRPARHWSHLTLMTGLLLGALLLVVLTHTLSWQGAVSVRLAQPVSAADLVALKEARLEAAEAVVLPALPQPVTATDLIALKEARTEAREPITLRQLPQPVTATDLVALKEAWAESR